MKHDDDDGSVPAPSPEEVMAASTTPQGAWTAKQLRKWGIRWPPPKGWRLQLARQHAAGERITPLRWSDVQADHMARRKADREASRGVEPKSKPAPVRELVVPPDPPAPQVLHRAPIRVRDTGKPADPAEPPPWM